jgi:hypothetical protein
MEKLCELPTGTIAFVTRGKMKGERVVIQGATPKKYHIRNTKKLPTVNRFLYNNKDRVSGTIGPYETSTVLKTSVQSLSNRTNENLNDWQEETSKLLEENLGKTRNEIQKKYGKANPNSVHINIW